MVSQMLARAFILTALLVLNGARGADQVAVVYPPVVYPPVIQGEPQALAMDKAGASFVAGRFMGTLDFNPGAGEDSKTSGGGFDVFVTRFNADGSYAWTTTFGGTLIDFPRAIVLSGNTLYVGGTFASTSAGIGGSGSFACKGLRDVFVWALDAATGASIATFGTGGIQTFGGSGTDNLQALAVAGKNLIVAGNFDSTDAGVGGTGTIQALHALDCYALMLDANTGLANVKFGADGAVVFGGSDVDEVAAALVSGSTLYLAGSFKSADFAFETTVLFAPIGIRSAFVLALNAKDGKLNAKFGAGKGAVRFGGSSDDRGLKLAVAGSTLFLGGNLLSQDGGLNDKGAFRSRGMNDAYVVALTKDGKINPKFGTNGLFQFGGNAEDVLGGMAVSKNLYLTGTFESENAPMGTGVIAAHVDKKDIFILALSPKDGKLVTKGGFAFNIFGGAEDEISNGLVIGKKAVFVAGTFNSLNAGYGGGGGFKFTDFGGLLLPFDILTGGLPVP